ncbi:MAG: radical SAM protein [Chitinispirillaceae bacterium]|nr:radical SAM protein [Chitinispirillaceae bacterium]
MKKIYIINPRLSTPSYFDFNFYRTFGFQPKSYMLDLAITTIASMAKPFFDVEICDESFKEANFNTDADVIAITGKVSQWQRMKVLSQIFHKKNKLVVIGGPHASLVPEVVRPYADVLVKDEIEDIYRKIFSEIASKNYKDTYIGTKPDLSNTVAPDLSIYPNHLTWLGALQTSRGCPFECEFCDVTAYLGRHQRHKPIKTIIYELQALADAGYSDIFLTDDNFTANRSKAKEKLNALGEWNSKRDNARIGFGTQMSLDCSTDNELLSLMAAASIDTAFVGIESPNVESLIEAKKRQNLVDIPDSINKFIQNGIQVIGGLIVGFDNDTTAIFNRILDFAQSMPIPVYTAGCLVAPYATTLYERLKRENRIIGDIDQQCVATPWDSNILPKKMSRDELLFGVKWLCSNLYHPKLFTERVMNFLNKYNFKSRPWFSQSGNPIASTRSERRHFIEDAMKCVTILSCMGENEKRMVEVLKARAQSYPINSVFIFSLLANYLQIREILGLKDIYSPELLGVAPFT